MKFKEPLQSHSQMTHTDSSSLTPQTSSAKRNLPLLPHFEHLLASLQVRISRLISVIFDLSIYTFLVCVFFCLVFAYFIKLHLCCFFFVSLPIVIFQAHLCSNSIIK